MHASALSLLTDSDVSPTPGFFAVAVLICIKQNWHNPQKKKNNHKSRFRTRHAHGTADTHSITQMHIQIGLVITFVYYVCMYMCARNIFLFVTVATPHDALHTHMSKYWLHVKNVTVYVCALFQFGFECKNKTAQRLHTSRRSRTKLTLSKKKLLAANEFLGANVNKSERNV